MKRKLNMHYAWIILLLSFIGLLAVQGMRLSFGASQHIVGKIIDKFGVRRIVSISTLIVGISIFIWYESIIAANSDLQP